METTMYALLATAKANNASDLHITVGVRQNAVSVVHYMRCRGLMS